MLPMRHSLMGENSIVRGLAHHIALVLLKDFCAVRVQRICYAVPTSCFASFTLTEQLVFRL